MMIEGGSNFVTRKSWRNSAGPASHDRDLFRFRCFIERNRYYARSYFLENGPRAGAQKHVCIVCVWVYERKFLSHAERNFGLILMKLDRVLDRYYRESCIDLESSRSNRRRKPEGDSILRILKIRRDDCRFCWDSTQCDKEHTTKKGCF